jgi:Ca2+-binding RTX toxin-like protein
VAHDGATGFAPLDADAAAGLGWAIGSEGGVVRGTAVQVVDADSLLVTFSGALPAGGSLYYGYGYGRLAGADGTGRGNAVYDNQGMPVWVAAGGLPLPPGLVPQSAGGLLLDGGAAADALAGGSGADTLAGGAGGDDLRGLGGDDVLRGGTGDDGMVGGAGADRFAFRRGDGVDWVEDFQPGLDRVVLEGVSPAEVTQAVATRWTYTGVVLRYGVDEVFVAGVTAPLGGGDLVLA